MRSKSEVGTAFECCVSSSARITYVFTFVFSFENVRLNNFDIINYYIRIFFRLVFVWLAFGFVCYHVVCVCVVCKRATNERHNKIASLLICFPFHSFAQNIWCCAQRWFLCLLEACSHLNYDLIKSVMTQFFSFSLSISRVLFPIFSVSFFNCFTIEIVFPSFLYSLKRC